MRSLSRTKPPAAEADMAFWPAWTNYPIDALGLVVLDGDGCPLSSTEGGC